MRTSTPAAMRLTWLGLFFILLGLSQTPFTSGTALTKSLAELSANCRQCTRRSEIVVPMITNSDWVLKAFWASLATGVTRANQLYNTSSVLLQPVSFSPVNEAALVAKAAQNYTLMGTTVADLANVAPAINTAVQNGTAVITFNVGDLFLAQDNAMNHIGQPESVAGAKMGGRMVALGSTNIVCIMHQIGSAGQTQRCQGANAGALAANSAVTFTTITADGSSVPSLTATVNAYLDANPTTDGIISLSQDVVNYYVTILQTRGQTNTVRLATFDVNLDIISKMASNKIAYCVDQQQVLQGFGTMLLLKTLYMTRGQKLLTKILLTGPSVVNSANSGPISCRLDNTQAGCVATLASSVTIGVVGLNPWSISDSNTQQTQYGALNAAREHGIKLKFLDAGTYDLQALSTAVQTAITGRTISALIMPFPSTASGQDFGALADQAAAASIPVFTYGTGAIRGAAKVASGSIKFHLGQDESASGALFGAKLNAIMPSNTQVLCLTVEVGSDDMPLKCAGIQSALTGGRTMLVQSGNSLVLSVSARVVVLAQQTLVTALNSNPNIGAIVFPNAEMARTVVAALATSSRASSPPILAGYGYNLDVAEMIRAGTVAFTADEQPFLQSYLATVFASFFLTDRLVLTNPLLETGPNFIDQTTLPTAICRADAAADPMAECPACVPLCTVNGKCLDSGACQCKSGWLLGPNADCQLKDPGLQFIAWNSPLAIIFSVLSALAIVFSGVLCVGIFIYRSTPMIKASSSSVGMAMQLGFAILYGSTFLYLGTPSTFTCAAQPFFLTIGISSVIGLLLAKTWRIYRLFSSVVQTRKSVIGYIVNAIVTGSISINIILCAIWMGVDPPVPTRQYISEGVTNYVCSSPRSSTFIGLLVAYNVILVLLGSTLGFLTRGVEERFNESRQIGFAMYNLLALAAIGVPILLASSWLMQLFYCVLSAVILIGGVATQSILFIPKIMSALGKSDDDEHGGGGLQNLGGFAGKMGTGSSGKKRPMSGNYGARTTTNSTQVTHADWETLVLYTAVRVVEGRLSSFSAMWASSAVMYFRDAKTRRPMLGVLSTANETGVGQFFDLTMVASTDAMKGNPGSSSVGTTTESSAASTGTAGTGGSTPNDAPPSMTAATRVIKVEMESGLKLFIKVPNGALFDLWSTVLGAGGGSQKSSGVASTSNALGATKTATTTAGGTLPKLSANKLSNN